MSAYLQDPVFWVLISFVTFVALVAKRGWNIIVTALDRRRETIIADLENAQELRLQAERRLAEERERRASAEEQAEAIIKAAEADIQRIKQQTQEEIRAAIARREAQAKQRIAQVETQATAEVRAAISSVAVAAAQKVMTEYIRNAPQDPLTDEGIENLPKYLH